MQAYPRRSQRPSKLKNLAFLAFLFLSLGTIRAQDANNDGILTEEEAKAAAKSTDNQAIKDFGREELLTSTTPLVSISSIDPEQGPMSGK